jgi:hypothetical protein
MDRSPVQGVVPKFLKGFINLKVDWDTEQAIGPNL